MALLTVGGGPKIADGLYEATCLHVDLKPPTPRSPDHQPWLLWTFLVHDGSEHGVSLTAISSTAQGARTKWRGWAEALLQRDLQHGEQLDTDLLSMKDCRIVVGFNKETGYCDITKVMPVSGPPPQAPAAPAVGWPTAPATPAPEPDDIPF